MATTERVCGVHSLPLQGPTAERPDLPPGGFFYFDTTIRMLLSFNSVLEEWVPAGIASGTSAERPAAGDVPPGSVYFNEDLAALEYSNGSTWVELEVTDEQSSSSSTSSSTSSSESSSTSSDSSSTSSSSSESSPSSDSSGE